MANIVGAISIVWEGVRVELILVGSVLLAVIGAILIGLT